MNRSTEELLRQALRQQAEQAVDPDRVRMALPARAARRSRRRYGSFAAGAVAAAALAAFAVPVLGLDDAAGRGGGGPAVGEQPAASPSASGPAAEPAATAPEAVALRYRPTWLPPGLRELSREVPLGPGNVYDGPVRIWKRAGAEAGLDMGGSRLEFAAIALKAGQNQFGDAGTVVDINGKPGRLVEADTDAKSKSYVHWLIDPQTVIFLHNVSFGISDADLMRIARSVQPDSGQLAVPLRLGRLPAGMAPFSAQFAGDSATNWQLEVTAVGKQATVASPTADKQGKEGTGSSERWVYVRLGKAVEAPSGGESIVVAGRPGRVVSKAIEGTRPDARHVWVVVTLESGLTLTVFGMTPDMSEAELVDVANGVEIRAMPDLGWLGA
jgi:hypothetical protein